GRTGLAILTAATIAWPTFTSPAAARGPEGVADVAEQVIDAVVNVSTKQSVDLRSGGAMPQLPPGSPFEEFFEEFFKNRRGQTGKMGRTTKRPRHVASIRLVRVLLLIRRASSSPTITSLPTLTKSMSFSM